MTNNNSLRQEIAWLIVERMNDSVGFDEAYEEVGEYLKIIEKRINKMIEETKPADKVIYAMSILQDVKKELLK